MYIFNLYFSGLEEKKKTKFTKALGFVTSLGQFRCSLSFPSIPQAFIHWPRLHNLWVVLKVPFR